MPCHKSREYFLKFDVLILPQIRTVDLLQLPIVKFCEKVKKQFGEKYNFWRFEVKNDKNWTPRISQQINSFTQKSWLLLLLWINRTCRSHFLTADTWGYTQWGQIFPNVASISLFFFQIIVYLSVTFFPPLYLV